MRAWRDLPGSHDPGHFDAWLHRLTVNASIDAIRKRTTCVVAAGQPILASGGRTLCDQAGGYGENEEELRACVDGDRPVFSNVSVTIDGEAVPDIDRFWIVSPLFEMSFPEGNAFGMDPVTTDAVAAGWFVMISDLAPGEHTIVVHDDIDIPDDEEGPMPAEVIATVQVVEPGASPVACPPDRPPTSRERTGRLLSRPSSR